MITTTMQLITTTVKSDQQVVHIYICYETQVIKVF